MKLDLTALLTTTKLISQVMISFEKTELNRNGGGVAIYIRNIIPYTICNHLLLSTVEAICIEINKPNSKPLLISTWYRPPDAKIELLVHFEIFLQNIDEEDKDFVITGDFNCNFL